MAEKVFCSKACLKAHVGEDHETTSVALVESVKDKVAKKAKSKTEREARKDRWEEFSAMVQPWLQV